MSEHSQNSFFALNETQLETLQHLKVILWLGISSSLIKRPNVHKQGSCLCFAFLQGTRGAVYETVLGEY